MTKTLKRGDPRVCVKVQTIEKICKRKHKGLKGKKSSTCSITTEDYIKKVGCINSAILYLTGVPFDPRSRAFDTWHFQKISIFDPRVLAEGLTFPKMRYTSAEKSWISFSKKWPEAWGLKDGKTHFMVTGWICQVEKGAELWLSSMG